MPLGTEVGLGPDDIVLDGDPAPLPKMAAEPLSPIFGSCLLWPNGFGPMYCGQTAGWIRMAFGMEVGLGRPHCARWGSSSLPKKGGRAPSPIYGPCLLWPNGWMDQDETWHGDASWFRPHCARWGPSSPPQKGRSPQFAAHDYCGQTAAWINMPLGTEVGLGPDDIVLDGDPAPPPQ